MEIKNIVLGIGIIIMTIFVAVYGINMFYPAPDYEDYCDPESAMKIINTSADCEQAGGRWNGNWCELDYLCYKEYDKAQESHAKIVFIIAVPLGIAILAVGMILFGLEAVGVGLMGGGIGTLIYGAGGYWQYGEDWARFIISLLGLVALIYLAYWFNKRVKKK